MKHPGVKVPVRQCALTADEERQLAEMLARKAERLRRLREEQKEER